MDASERARLRAHHEVLKSQRALLETMATDGQYVIDLITFRTVADEIGRVKAGSPTLLPPFNEREFATPDAPGYFQLMPLRMYMVTALGKLATALVATPEVDIPAMLVDRQAVFFAGQYFDATKRISGIVAAAKSSITIVDGYIDMSILDTLSAKAKGVEVRILTKSLPQAMKPMVQAFSKQYGDLTIRRSEAFHDRFVIVDDNEWFPANIAGHGRSARRVMQKGAGWMDVVAAE